MSVDWTAISASIKATKLLCDAVIAKLESVKEGSVKLDEEVWRALGGGDLPKTVPPFTQSIDGARKAVPRPNGSMGVATTFGVGGFQDDRPHSAWAWVSHDCSMAGGPSAPPYESKAASPALALCAAALKAFAEAGGRHDLPS